MIIDNLRKTLIQTISSRKIRVPANTICNYCNNSYQTLSHKIEVCKEIQQIPIDLIKNLFMEEILPFSPE